MHDYDFRHIPAKFHSLFKQAYAALEKGDKAAAITAYNKLPDETWDYAETQYLHQSITGQSAEPQDSRSVVERNSAVEQGTTAQRLMFPAESPAERAARGHSVGDDPQPDYLGEGQSIAQRSGAVQKVAAANGQAAALAEGDFDRFANEYAQARRADNERETNRGSEFGDDFDAGLKAAREKDYQGKAWSEEIEYQPEPEKPAPADSDLPSRDLAAWKNLRLSRA